MAKDRTLVEKVGVRRAKEERGESELIERYGRGGATPNSDLFLVRVGKGY